MFFLGCTRAKNLGLTIILWEFGNLDAHIVEKKLGCHWTNAPFGLQEGQVAGLT
jgi:hypothetical protein